MKTSPLTLLLAVALFGAAAGCQPGTTAMDPKTDGAKAGKEPGATGTPEAPKPDVSAIPASLRHDGLAYSGLDRSGPLNYLFARVAGEKPEPGAYSVKFEGVEGAVAKFSTTRDGSLAALGSEQIEVREDGVYLTGSSVGTPKSPVKMLPAKLEVGTVWDDTYEMTDQAGTAVKYSGKSKVEKAETLTIGGKSFETLLVTQGAEMVRGSDTSKVASKTWYAKGYGAVRVRIELKGQGGAIVTSTIDIDPKE